MNERRQRTARLVSGGRRGLRTFAGVLAVLGLLSGCEARSSLDAAQTAVSVAQTTVPGVQTVLPGMQSTAEAGATLVVGVLNDPRAINAQLQLLLLGANVDVTATPADASKDAVTEVTIRAVDARGSFAQLDPRARQAAAAAAVTLVAQYYPSARVSLTVVDSSGSVLQTASKAGGMMPATQ